jgi:DNA-binding Lrp family transcriptional regulator
MLSKSEKKVLAALCYNSRATLTELAKKTKLTRQTVYKALQSLNKEVVDYYGPMFDPEKIGLEMRAFVLICAQREGFREQLMEALKQMDEISQAHEVLGRYDVLVEALVPSRKDLTTLLYKINKLPPVTRTETLLVTETFKFDTLKPVINILGKEGV